MSLLRFLGLAAKDQQADEDDSETIRRIASQLDRLEPERARYLAAFAYLLGRVAHVDLAISEAETRTMERIVAEHGELPPAQASLVVEIAKTQNVLFGGTEDYLVTRAFGEMATREQKLALLDCLFAVSSADAGITVIEDNEIRRIAQQLRLEHQDFITARAAYRQHLNVLKPRGGGS